MSVDYKEIGRRVTKIRKQRGLTQEKLSEKCDLSPQYISNIERSISIPSTETLLRICEVLEVTPDAILLGVIRHEDETWRGVAERLRTMDEKHLALADSLLRWVAEQDL